MDDLELTLH